MKNHGNRFLWILGIAALCVWLIASKGIKLGLDLDGGSSLTYAVRDGEGNIPARDKLERAIEVITKRVNATGLTEIYITSTSTGEIVVEMPRRDPKEVTNVKSLIQRNGQLEFRICEEAEAEASQRASREANPKLYRCPQDRRWVLLAPREAARRNVPDVLVKVPEAPLEAAWRQLVASKGATDRDTVEAEKRFRDTASAEVFVGEDLDKTGVVLEGAQRYVTFDFKEHRKNDFKNFTERNVGKQMAILLDGKVDSAPVIRSVLPGGGRIEGGGSGGFSESEANDLRIVLESGSTGVQLSLDREETLSASLGEVAIERGKWSVGVGFLAVVILMVVYYRLPGMIANLALLLNVAMILGALAFFRGALSLPGIAGIVLTLGMAVDANILIFERLRDERRRGKSLQESLAAGYDNAMSAIVDGNVTTVLTALVLIFLGTGAVKGFGVTLTIGLLASMFTAIWVTRTVFDWLVDTGKMTTFDIGPDPKEPTWDYMKARKWLTMPSLALMALGTIGFLMRPEDQSKDLEFIGGQQVIVQLREAVSPDVMLARVAGPANEYEGATAVAIEAAEGAAKPTTKGWSSTWQIRAKATDTRRGEEYVAYLRKSLGDLFVSPPYTDWTETPAKPGEKGKTTFVVHTLTPVEDVAAMKSALLAQQLPNVTAEPVEGSDGKAFRVSMDSPEGGAMVIEPKVRAALTSLAKPVKLSEPTPSVSFLSPVQAEHLWRIALEAMLVSLAVQVVYIRLRFADYAHGFAAVLALVHDVTITLGAVALFDSLGIVYAKINLVLIAAFLTLIGYSMNDTIVVFDRMRENLGRSKVLRSRIINDSINQTFARSIRTGLTVFVTVVVQFLFNRKLGSSIEGFAWVMMVGSISGAYSSIFIAAPLLLFLPGYGKRLTASRPAFLAMVVMTIAGSIVAVTAKGHGTSLWIGVGLASVIPLHFLAHFIPWLGHRDPDELVLAESDEAEDESPVVPGV